jgi:hypothetical protein
LFRVGFVNWFPETSTQEWTNAMRQGPCAVVVRVHANESSRLWPQACLYASIRVVEH